MKFGKSVTLIPFSGVQFIDFEFSASDLSHVRRRFYEQPASEQTNYQSVLHPIVMEDGELRDPLTQAIIANDHTIGVSGQKSIAPFLQRWVPIPVMRVIQGAGGAGELAKLDEGPINWARLHISAGGLDDEGQVGTYHVVMAIDTGIDMRGRTQGDPYLAPTSVDVAMHSHFCFSDKVDDVAWFVSEPWVDAWVQDLFTAGCERAARRDQERANAASGHAETGVGGLAHLAHYLTMLSVVNDLCDLPQIRFLDTADRRNPAGPIDVDLVVDFGQARTFGVLMEHHDPQQRHDLSQTNVLALRDLSAPARIYCKPFESRVEFSPSSFGDQALSRQSGRGCAFFWPSFARIGDEAQRLDGRHCGAETPSGLNGLKRYLLDDSAAPAGWFFASAQEGLENRPQQVYGPLLKFIGESGNVVGHIGADGKAEEKAAVRAKFSRSSLTSIFFCEIVQQALVQINSVYWRAHHPSVNAARQLKRIIIPRPIGLSAAECETLLYRVDAGVELLWQAMGWAGEGPVAAPPRPQVAFGLDDAAGAQTVFLYDQIARKFNGSIRDYLALKGKSRAHSGAQCVAQIAAIDIGAASMSLTVRTIRAATDDQLQQSQVLRANIACGGEHLITAVVEAFIKPALKADLGVHDQAARTEHGAVHSNALNAALNQGGNGVVAGSGCAATSAATINEAIEALNGDNDLNALLRKFALALLAAHEGREPDAFDLAVPTTLGQLLSDFAPGTFAAGPAGPADLADTTEMAGLADTTEMAHRAIVKLNQICAGLINAEFCVANCAVNIRPSQMSAIVKAVLGGPLQDMASLIAALDCDCCLLSGRVAQLREVGEILIAARPVRIDRMVFLSDYRPAAWYPLAEANGQIGDAKTVTAAGALIHSIGPGRLQGVAQEEIDGSVTASHPAQAAQFGAAQFGAKNGTQTPQPGQPLAAQDNLALDGAQAKAGNLAKEDKAAGDQGSMQRYVVEIDDQGRIRPARNAQTPAQEHGRNRHRQGPRGCEPYHIILECDASLLPENFAADVSEVDHADDDHPDDNRNIYSTDHGQPAQHMSAVDETGGVSDVGAEPGHAGTTNPEALVSSAAEVSARSLPNQAAIQSDRETLGECGAQEAQDLVSPNETGRRSQSVQGSEVNPSAPTVSAPGENPGAPEQAEETSLIEVEPRPALKRFGR